MRKPPCGNCPEKGCGGKHDTCGKYLAWLAGRDEVMKEAVKEAIANATYAELVYSTKRWMFKHDRKS